VQLDRVTPPAGVRTLAPSKDHPAHPGKDQSEPAPLEFSNGLGGFDNDGREYVIRTAADAFTPAPWINVVSNPQFGFQVSAEGAGFTWSLNSRENQLTAWSNDPVCDPTGDAFYIRDADSGVLWCPTAAPIAESGTVYVARHAQGFSRFQSEAHDISLDLLMFVPLHDPLKISRLVIRNTGHHARRLSVTSYIEWVLGTSRTATAPFIVTEMDRATGAVFAHNTWTTVYSTRIAFADLGGRQTQWTTDRTEFLGRHGSLAAPAALIHDVPLAHREGAGLDPCSALQTTVEIAPGAQIELICLLGQADSRHEAQALIARYRSADLTAVLNEVVQHWDSVLGTIQIRTPDRAFDVALNRWMLYQTLACRVWARSGFYQASGAYGFRDQLQDTMALIAAAPQLTREQLLRAAGRQFVEGDVQHWWLPPTGQGVRTRISDDRAWLAYITAHYIDATGDAAVLDESVPFLEGQKLRPEEHDAYFLPSLANTTGSLFEHCARALDQSLTVGVHGLPLMGTGDWNDGMNRVGEKGKGESVWLGWLLYATLTRFAALAKTRGEPARAQSWSQHAAALLQSMETDGWDGQWYRRAYFDDGTPLGSASNDECQIDAIAQSWRLMAGIAPDERATRAMTAVQERLLKPDDALVLLFEPPFNDTALDPGYIKGYPPGIRENGGQYTHAATWTVIAFAILGDGKRAFDAFAMLNPINHATTAGQVQRYRVEPYVVAGDVYSMPPHVGRGGWTWYTGSAGWMYQAGIHWILGLRFEGTHLRIDPCIPAEWPGFEAALQWKSSRYEIHVENAGHVSRGVERLELDGAGLPASPPLVPLSDDGNTHHVRAVLG
jgi:cyclic beta-1,2-glucan synthetase